MRVLSGIFCVVLILFALVLMMFAAGVLDLFIRSVEDLKLRVQQGLRVNTIGELKSALAEVIVIILFVKFLELVLFATNHLPWEALTLPLAVLALSAGLRLLDLRGHGPPGDKGG